MAYVTPTPADLKLRNPEFGPVSDARIQIFLDEAILEVGDSWLESDRARAQILLASHRLILAGEPGLSAGTSSGSGSTLGSPESIKVGDVTVAYGSRSGSSNSAVSGLSAVEQEYLRTSYGVQYLEILHKNSYPALAI